MPFLEPLTSNVTQVYLSTTISDALDMPYGSTLNIAASQTLTINGTIKAGPYQIFTGTGTATFAAGQTEYLLSEWWGAGIGGNDGPPIASALAEVIPVHLLAKTYASTTSITPGPDARIVGRDRKSTTIQNNISGGGILFNCPAAQNALEIVDLLISAATARVTGSVGIATPGTGIPGWTFTNLALLNLKTGIHILGNDRVGRVQNLQVNGCAVGILTDGANDASYWDIEGVFDGTGVPTVSGLNDGTAIISNASAGINGSWKIRGDFIFWAQRALWLTNHQGTIISQFHVESGKAHSGSTDPGTGATIAAEDIYLVTCQGVVINGGDMGGDDVTQYGITVERSQDCVISGVAFTRYLTAAIHLNGGITHLGANSWYGSVTATEPSLGFLQMDTNTQCTTEERSRWHIHWTIGATAVGTNLTNAYPYKVPAKQCLEEVVIYFDATGTGGTTGSVFTLVDNAGTTLKSFTVAPGNIFARFTPGAGLDTYDLWGGYGSTVGMSIFYTSDDNTTKPAGLHMMLKFAVMP